MSFISPSQKPELRAYLKAQIKDTTKSTETGSLCFKPLPKAANELRLISCALRSSLRRTLCPNSRGDCPSSVHYTYTDTSHVNTHPHTHAHNLLHCIFFCIIKPFTLYQCVETFNLLPDTAWASIKTWPHPWIRHASAAGITSTITKNVTLSKKIK